MKFHQAGWAAILLAAAWATPAPAAEQSAAVVTADFSGRNFVFGSAGQAKDGLRDRLLEALELKLLGLGYAREDAATLAASMKASALSVEEKKVDIAEGGKVRKGVKVYDISGAAAVHLGPAETTKLFNTITAMKTDSAQEVDRFRDLVSKFRGLNADAGQVMELRLQLARAWMKTSREQIRAALSDRGAGIETYIKSAIDAYALAGAYASETGDDTGAATLRSDIDALTVKYFQVTPADSGNAAQLLAAAGMLSQASPGANPDPGRRAMEAAEFNWRKKVLETEVKDEAGVGWLKNEADTFARLLPESRMLQDILRKLETAQARLLQDLAPDDGDTFISFISQFKDFAARFPSSKSMPAVTDAVRRQCGSVLLGLEARSDDNYAALTKCWEVCISAAKGKAHYDLLKEAQIDFIEANKARNEREMLGSLGFLLYWDRAAGAVKFGGQRGSFPSGKAAEMWNSGEAYKQCICRSSQDDMCRQVYYSGDYYEAVAKFGRSGLYEIELCNFGMPPGKRAFIYQAFKDRYVPEHESAAGDRFVNGISGDELGFSPTGGRKHHVLLSASGEKGSVRWSVPELAPRTAGEPAKPAQAPRSRARAWKEGDCVRWGCDPLECKYLGKVKGKRGDRYMVTVKKSPKSIELDMNVPKDPEALLSCEE